MCEVAEVFRGLDTAATLHCAKQKVGRNGRCKAASFLLLDQPHRTAEVTGKQTLASFWGLPWPVQARLAASTWILGILSREQLHTGARVHASHPIEMAGPQHQILKPSAHFETESS